MKYDAPKISSLKDILPQTPTLLMGAGPVPIPKEVAIANGMVISHLGDTMKLVVSRVQSMARYVFQTNSSKIFGIAGPSSAAMEMATTALLWPGRRVLVLNLGTFSARFAELAKGVGADVTEMFHVGMRPFNPEDVKKMLQENKFDVLTLVQGETSCGVKNIELQQIVQVAKSFNVLTIVDAVCTLSTMPLPMDEWEIDVVVVGGQKGLSAIPGIALIAFSDKAYETLNAREALMPHWCLDPRRANKFWSLGEYHYTAPVPAILAMHEGLRLICEETLEKRFERHLFCSKTLQRCLEVMGLELFTPEDYRLNSVVAIKNKNSINTKELLSYLIKVHHVEISGAFGLDIIRIGQMGEQCRLENIETVLKAVGAGYLHMGVVLDTENALEEFRRLSKNFLQ
jgi:alanine-glyoxylate transaminase/serine-glyoxylate transaminase/serine-pyruvate transaminase